MIFENPLPISPGSKGGGGGGEAGTWGGRSKGEGISVRDLELIFISWINWNSLISFYIRLIEEIRIFIDFSFHIIIY